MRQVLTDRSRSLSGRLAFAVGTALYTPYRIFHEIAWRDGGGIRTIPPTMMAIGELSVSERRQHLVHESREFGLMAGPCFGESLLKLTACRSRSDPQHVGSSLQPLTLRN